MDHLRQSIHLRSYAQSNPLQDYVNEGFKMFKDLNQKIAVEFVGTILTAKLEMKTQPAVPPTVEPGYQPVKEPSK